jgi:capsule polysaccharide export protein KpsC/LpsZ
MTWYKIEISAQQAASNHHGKIQDQYEKIFIISQDRQEMALFSGGWSTSNKFNMYFTPACASNPAMKALMEMHGAKLCDEPTRETENELGLLVGDQRQWGNFIWSPDLT